MTYTTRTGNTNRFSSMPTIQQVQEKDNAALMADFVLRVPVSHVPSRSSSPKKLGSRYS